MTAVAVLGVTTAALAAFPVVPATFSGDYVTFNSIGTGEPPTRT
jgi:hypothetical protein